MAGLLEQARDLGASLGRTDEYQALRRAIRAADDDKELVELRNAVLAVEERFATQVREGQEPDQGLAREYDEAVSRLQACTGYQRLVAAQTNFDKVMAKVHQAIAEAIEEAGDSRIVIPS